MENSTTTIAYGLMTGTFCFSQFDASTIAVKALD